MGEKELAWLLVAFVITTIACLGCSAFEKYCDTQLQIAKIEEAKK